MRFLLAATFFLFGLGSALPEQTFDTLYGVHTDTGANIGSPSFIEIDSANRADARQNAAAPENPPAEEMPHLDAAALLLEPINPDFASKQDSISELCDALFTAAQDNGLPVQFLANLIYQESGLRNNTVSRAGALGIAQFMPATAKENGLSDPFDPHQAIPASAKLLQQLRSQFGNLGFAAAAYNAGPHRVNDWLASGHALPRETLDYVLRVTGRSAEQWRTDPPAENTLTFTQELPCRTLPAFANLEKSLAQEAQAEPPQPVKTATIEHQKDKAAPHPKLQIAKLEFAAEHHAASNKTSLARNWAKILTIAVREPGDRHTTHERRETRESSKERREAHESGKSERGRKLADARENRNRPSHSRS